MRYKGKLISMIVLAVLILLTLWAFLKGQNIEELVEAKIAERIKG